MPRNVRNFWIELDVDGSKSRVETGPRNKEGGFSMVIRQRDGGDISTALVLRGYVLSNGQLVLDATSADGKAQILHKTTR